MQRNFAAAVRDGLTVFDSGGMADGRAVAEVGGGSADPDGGAVSVEAAAVNAEEV